MFYVIELNNEIFIALVSVVGTIIAALFAFITNQKNRKQESLRNIICAERLEYLENFRKSYEKLILLVRKETVLNNQSSNKIHELLEVSTKFECVLKTFYKEEKEIVLLEKKVVKYVISFYQEGTLPENYQQLVDELYSLCQIYDWAYWKYVQKLAVKGKYLNSDEDFDQFYQELYDKINNK